MVAADFNGDGKIDLAVANGGSNTVSVLLGNGDGTFAAATNYSVGSDPVALAVGDFNGDGLPDLAVVNHGSNNETVLANGGGGVYTMLQTIALGESADSVVVGDFNNDGSADQVIDGSIHGIMQDKKAAPVKLNPITIGERIAQLKKMGKDSDLNPYLMRKFNVAQANLGAFQNAAGAIIGTNDQIVIDVSFFILTQFSVDLNGLDGSIIQSWPKGFVAQYESKVPGVPNKTEVLVNPFVEGWVVNNGMAAGPDTHKIENLTLSTTTYKSVTLTGVAEVGAGLYNKEKITGNRGDKPGSAQGIFDIFRQGKANLIDWLGNANENTKYTFRFTLFDDGFWILDDPSAGVINETGTVTGKAVPLEITK